MGGNGDGTSTSNCLAGRVTTGIRTSAAADDVGARPVLLPSLSFELLSTARSARALAGAGALRLSPQIPAELLGLARVDSPTRESVHATPPAGDVEELDPSDSDRRGGIHTQVFAARLESEHRAQQQQRRARRPGLRAARGRILHGVFGVF